jgi:hypothetical protein
MGTIQVGALPSGWQAWFLSKPGPAGREPRSVVTMRLQKAPELPRCSFVKAPGPEDSHCVLNCVLFQSALRDVLS